MSSFMGHYGVQVFIAFAAFGLIAILLVAYLSFSRIGERKRIAERGIQSLAGKCPKCSGKLKAVDLFSGRAELKPYKIGAARCNLCHHLEIFSEEY